MTGRSLGSLLASAGVVPSGTFADDTMVSGVSIDSRTVRAGDVFFALRGEREDGARFAPEALRRGAVAVVAEVPAPQPAMDPAWIRVPDGIGGRNSRSLMGSLTFATFTTEIVFSRAPSRMWIKWGNWIFAATSLNSENSNVDCAVSNRSMNSILTTA
jgi:UDP-N-acetylmuramyl pentapeptide synthase